MITPAPRLRARRAAHRPSDEFTISPDLHPYEPQPVGVQTAAPDPADTVLHTAETPGNPPA